MKKFPGIKSTVVGAVIVVWVETQITQGILAPRYTTINKV
jgi:hypothetical protein